WAETVVGRTAGHENSARILLPKARSQPPPQRARRARRTSRIVSTWHSPSHSVSGAISEIGTAQRLTVGPRAQPGEHSRGNRVGDGTDGAVHEQNVQRGRVGGAELGKAVLAAGLVRVAGGRAVGVAHAVPIVAGRVAFVVIGSTGLA